MDKLHLVSWMPAEIFVHIAAVLVVVSLGRMWYTITSSRTYDHRRCTGVGTKTKFYIVAADALPEIFIRVAEAKRMLQTGEADTVGAATRQVGISRSAFYKYKDAVQPFNDMKVGHIITFYAMLKDNPGVLSNVLSIFAGSGANILTINQSIPTNGCAAVTISAETSDMDQSLEELITTASTVEGVVKFEILAG